MLQIPLETSCFAFQSVHVLSTLIVILSHIRINQIPPYIPKHATYFAPLA